jgi:hypothetical protein
MAMQPFEKRKRRKQRMFFLIFLLKCFKVRRKQNPMLISFSFPNNNEKQCRERKKPN